MLLSCVFLKYANLTIDFFQVSYLNLTPATIFLLYILTLQDWQLAPNGKNDFFKQCKTFPHANFFKCLFCKIYYFSQLNEFIV